MKGPVIPCPITAFTAAVGPSSLGEGTSSLPPGPHSGILQLAVSSRPRLARPPPLLSPTGAGAGVRDVQGESPPALAALPSGRPKCA